MDIRPSLISDQFMFLPGFKAVDVGWCYAKAFDVRITVNDFSRKIRQAIDDRQLELRNRFPDATLEFRVIGALPHLS